MLNGLVSMSNQEKALLRCFLDTQIDKK